MRIFRNQMDPGNAYALNYTAQTPSYGSVELTTRTALLAITRNGLSGLVMLIVG
jgi:hypothetical protein